MMEEELHIEVPEKGSRFSMIGWGFGVFCVIGAIFTIWAIMWIY